MKQSPRILKLSAQLANQIAAGEVIERPASVLKEILENSIDAGSTQIEVEIESAGIGLIRVKDNGCGICKEDLALAVSQHATSKITSLQDLENVKSLGFRGEALASIASVSRFSLSASVPSQETGWEIHQEGREGSVVLKPIPKVPGTTVEVRDLFYNTPARRKFLRGHKTENHHLEEIFKTLVLSQPEIAFVLKQGDKIKRYPSCRTRSAEDHRVANICGQHFMRNSVFLEAENNGLQLRGWLGNAEACRAQADLQYFFVNGRVVRDKLINHAVKQAYEILKTEGRFPAYLLFFQIDPYALDVNVHPTKHELRFREPRAVHAFLSYAIQEALTKTEVSLSLPLGENSENTMVFQNTMIPRHAMVSQDAMHSQNFMTSQKVKPKAALPKMSQSHMTLLKYVSILFNEFLLTENDEGWMLINIKKLRQKYHSEMLQAEYAIGGVQSRSLIMPETIELGAGIAGMANFEKNSTFWQRLGFEFTQSGNTTLLLRKLPAIFKTFNKEDAQFIARLFEKNTSEEVIDSLTAHLAMSPITLEESARLVQMVYQEKVLQATAEELSEIFRQLNPTDLRKLFKPMPDPRSALEIFKKEGETQ